MPSKGEIFKYIQFEFEDGSKGDKYFVALNNSNINIPCVALKTTLQNRRYIGCANGCNFSRKCFFVPSSWQNCFPIDTYIQLPEIFEFLASELLMKGANGELEFQNNPLEQKCFNQLLQCLAQFKYDINKTHWNLIYK